MNIDRLISQHERMKDAACGLDDAATDFARNCNGNNGHIIPAPTQYEILGNLKVAVWGIREVVEFLPAGLANALANPDTVTTDRDVLTGEQRDPAESQRIHADALRVAKQSLNTLCEALEEGPDRDQLSGLRGGHVGRQGVDDAELQRTAAEPVARRDSLGI